MKPLFLKRVDLPLAHLKVKGAIMSQNALQKVYAVSLLSEVAWGGCQSLSDVGYTSSAVHTETVVL